MKLSEKFIKRRKIPKGHERAVTYFTLEELKIYGEICRLEEKYIWRRAMGARVSAEYCQIELKKYEKKL